MTAVAPDTDRALFDQLAPACEIVDHTQTCDHPAGWIIWVTAPWLTDCPRILECDAHKAFWAEHYATCSHCRGLGITFHAEPLR